MDMEHLDQEELVRQRMTEEEKIRQRVDTEGNGWTKIYFGSGAHF